MDGFKLFSNIANELKNFSDAIAIEFSLDKCVKAHFKRMK